MAWTVEADATLRACIEQGMTFTETARAVNAAHGTAHSRNAAIGRASRLHITSNSGQRSHRVKPESERAPRKPRAPVVKPSTMPPGSLASKVVHGIKARAKSPKLGRDYAQLRDAPVEPRHVTLLELDRGQCHWPFGDGPSFTFCGCPTVDDDRPYCAAHQAIACTSSLVKAA